jgi:hypothetical protein
LNKSIKSAAEKKYRLDPFAYYIYAGMIAIITVVVLLHFLVTTPSIQSSENVLWYRRFLYFDYMFILLFSATAFLSGLFLFYVDFGGNKKIGIYFIIMGIVVFTMGFLYFDRLFPRAWDNPSNVYQALVSVLGTLLGFVAAIMVTFTVIIKVGPHIPNLSPRKTRMKKKGRGV